MPTSYRGRIRDLLLMVASSITIIGTTAIAASLPMMSDAFASTAHGHYLVKISLTVPALTAGLFAVPMGQIVDRWGRKPLFLASLVLYGGAGCAGFVLHSLYGILVSRLLLGIAVSAVATCATALIADYTSKDQIGRVMGRQSLFMALGNVVFVFAGGLLATQGWRWPFLLYAVGFVLIPGVVLLISEPRRAAKPAEPELREEAAPMAIGTITFTYVLLFVNMLVYFMVPVYLPFYLSSFSGENSVRAGALLSVVGVAWAIASTQYKRLARRLPYDRITVLTFALLGAAYVLLGTASAYPVVVVALILTGAGLGSTIPNLNAWMLAVTPPAVKGRVIGTRVSTTFLGQCISPVVTAPLVAALGIGQSYVIAGVLMLGVSAGTAVFLAVRARRASPPPAAFKPSDPLLVGHAPKQTD